MDLQKYTQFVEAVTSAESNNPKDFINRFNELESTTEVNMSLLLTAALGISAEGGEFAEPVKKCLLQGKPLDKATQFHMKRELGDIMFYWITACRALNIKADDVIQENINKLEARYPGGKFNVQCSENRKENDI